MEGMSIKQGEVKDNRGSEMYCYTDAGIPYIGTDFSRNHVSALSSSRFKNHLPVRIKKEQLDFHHDDTSSSASSDIWNSNKFYNQELSNNIKTENCGEENKSLPLSKKAPFIFPSSSNSVEVIHKPILNSKISDSRIKEICKSVNEGDGSVSEESINTPMSSEGCHIQNPMDKVVKHSDLQSTELHYTENRQQRKQITQAFDSLIKKSTKKTKALFQQGAELNDVKVKRLDKIIQEVRLNLDIDKGFPTGKEVKMKDNTDKQNYSSLMDNTDKQNYSSLTDESDHMDLSGDDEIGVQVQDGSEEDDYPEFIGKNSIQTKENLDSIWSKEVKAPSGEHRYHCSACEKGFYYMSHLRKHYLIHLHIKPYKCTVCDRSFHQNSNLKTHMRTHAEQKAFNCQLCDKGFNHNASLQIHLRTHTGERPYICNYCGKSFSRKNTLKVHEISHSEDKPYECKDCGKKFGRRYVLQRHILTHTGEKPYKCKTCGRDFAQNGDLHKHERIHTGEKPYVCTTCGKAFCQNGDLQKHMRIHLKVKRTYSCQNCDLIFTNKNKLRDHAKTHKEKLLFVCTTCSMEFVDIDKFQVHRMKHLNTAPGASNTLDLKISNNESLKIEEEPDYNEEDWCPDQQNVKETEKGSAYTSGETEEGQCPETNTVEQENIVIKKEAISDEESEKPIEMSLVENTDNVHSCYMCGLRFNTSDELTQHAVTHEGELPFICPTCGKGYRQKGLLQAHVRSHTGETPFACVECGKSFRLNRDLKRHVQIHTGIRPFVCKVCNRGFRWNWDLRKHSRIHSDERPFICETCGKAFRQNCILKSHMKTHSGVKPFVCNICHKGLTKSTDLMRHMRIHTGEKSYFCPVCEKAFGYKYNVQKHLETHVKKGHIDLESFKDFCKNVTKCNE